MPMKIGRGDKKKNLLAYKEKLLQELKYYEQRIDETRRSVNKFTSFDNDASSDSDTGLPQLLDSGPPISQLKSQQAMLRTCLQATQELAGLELVQHEMNVLTEPPNILGEPPITEQGTWQEVTAECCIDLVPFSITFYTFRADRKFAPLQYRGLRVLPLKAAHGAELERSVLPGLRRPSDAVEVVRSYAASYRARRSALARLADRFAAALHMEPLEDGGYLLRCADLLEVSWTLQNKWSPIAPFHHKMKFDLEYMEEQHIKTITQAHRQLANPSIDTDERTLLLATIISTCLQARPQGEAVDCAGVDREVMAPPRSLPKKVKSKNKENTPSNQKATKRSAQQENNVDTVKKPRTTDQKPLAGEMAENVDKDSEKPNNDTIKTTKSVASAKSSQKNVANTKNQPEKWVANIENAVSDRLSQVSVANTKNSAEKAIPNDDGKVSERNSQKNVASAKNKPKKSVARVENKVSDKIAQKDVGNTKSKQGDGAASVENVVSKKSSVATAKNNESYPVDKTTEITKNSKKTDKAKIANKNVDSKEDGSKNVDKSKPDTKNTGNANVVTKNPPVEKHNMKSVASAKSNTNHPKNVDNASNTTEKPVTTKMKNAENPDSVKQTATAKDSDEKVVKKDKKVANEEGKPKNINKVVNGPKVVTRNSIGRVEIDTNNETAKKTASNNKDKPVKGVASAKNATQKLPNTNIKKTTETANIDQTKKALTEKNIKIKPPILSKPTKVLPKPKVTAIATKINMPGNTEKENASVNKAKMSKIPQKRVSTPKLIKKMPNRISPRKPLPKPKAPPVGASMKTIIQKPVTGIPRLMTKTKPKVK